MTVRHRPSRTFAVFAIALLPACAAWAAHPLLSDDPGTQGDGQWQWELNTDRTRATAATGAAQQVNATLTRGVGDTLDLAINAVWLRNSAVHGPTMQGAGDATLELKWRFHDNGRGWALALRPTLTLPTGSVRKQLGLGHASATLMLLSSVSAGDWAWLVNAGYTVNAATGPRRPGQWTLSSALLYQPVPAWSLALDAGASRAQAAGATTARYALLGLIHHPHPNLDLDIGWRRNWQGSAAAGNTLGAGLTVRW